MSPATSKSARTPRKSEVPNPEYDIVILGSGLAGTTLAACLAKGGANVLIVDAGSHPRFAVGESTIPYTSMLLRLVSERYGVPEIKWLTTFESVQSKITPNCGIKRNFGFLYHREGQRQNPVEAHQFPIPKITHTENHFFRQDIDAWMLAVAVDYGVDVRQKTAVDDVKIDDDGVTVLVERGDPVRAKFVVDASGFRSPLARRFDLREEPTRLRHHSRSLFTHMVGVEPYENTVPKGIHGNPSRWSQGTLHHLFDGGWTWVIPFDNHSRAINPLCSVGLSLDPRMHPEPDCSPAEEFDRWLKSYPDAARQFKNARPVREWVRTGRLQYSSKQTVGYRWCLTSHAAGFIDALFSRGLSNTMEIVNALAWRLLDAIRDDDFDVERFRYVQELEQGLLDFNDDLVANSYTSFRDFDLWDAWFRVWSLGQVMATMEINRTYARYLDSRDNADLTRLAGLAPSGSIPDYPPLRRLLKEVSELTQAVQVGRSDPKEAAAGIMRLLAAADYVPPMFGLSDPDNRWFHATNVKAVQALLWARNAPSREIGDLVLEGWGLFMKKRFSRDEFAFTEELKNAVASWPVVGAKLRTKKY
ncbi:NAD(P)/FAD-dependent oxidoreductase [Streptomyces sp. NPDC050704]|uniref:NAD(P)/FAD-dependent oxidoreductase n=1 Tax=Streptomyces sp. NPDC050704 TaxID=3157219 RepID=UPI00341AF080